MAANCGRQEISFAGTWGPFEPLYDFSILIYIGVFAIDSYHGISSCSTHNDGAKQEEYRARAWMSGYPYTCVCLSSALAGALQMSFVHHEVAATSCRR